MTYQQIFKDVKKYFIKANTSHFTQEFAFQFNITGEGEGIFYAAYKNGALEVEPYDYLDRDVIFEADGTTFKEIAAGNLEVIDAVKAGKLAIDGDHEAAKQLLFLVSSKKTASKKAAPKSDAKKNEEKKTASKPDAKKTEEKKAAAPVKRDTKTAVKDSPKAEAQKTETAAKKAKASVKAAPKAADKEVKPAAKTAAKEKKAPAKGSKAAEKGKK